MITIEELKQRQELFDEEIKERAKELKLTNDGFFPISDGVADIEMYLSSSPRVMWILKEPFDDEGGYSMPDDIKEKGELMSCKIDQIPTYQGMVYVMEGLRTGLDYNSMRESKDMPLHLQNIAYININKMPAKGGRRSNYSLLPYYENWKQITLKQIEAYSPEVIIFGNTYHLFQNDGVFFDSVDISKDDELYKQGIIIRKQNGILLVDAYHPSKYETYQKEGYIDSMAKYIRKYYSHSS